MPFYDYECEICGKARRDWRENKPPRFCSRECCKIGMVGQACKRGKFVITPEMSARIEKVYKRDSGNGQIAALAKSLNLPRWKVTRYAQRQGWIAKTKAEPLWSEEEIELLFKYSRYCLEKIQLKLKKRGFNRTITSIAIKMQRLNTRQNIEGHSAHDVARCLGVDEKNITRAINLGKLKAKRRGTARTAIQGGDMWYIKDGAVRDYIIDNLNEIDIRKVDKFWFVDLLIGIATD